MSTGYQQAQGVGDEAVRLRRKRYLVATVITCISLAMVGGSLHILQLGSKRMDEMRAKAGYDLSEESTRIRAAGEEIGRHQAHEERVVVHDSYTIAEAEALLAPEQWAQIDAMVDVPAGQFVMGTDSTRSSVQNRPQHHVTLPAFRIGKFPVTNAQYARFVAATGHRPPLNWEGGKIPQGMKLHPVTMVSWYDANDYAQWAGGRLPREAEWEKAARGDDGRRWPWGDEMDAARLNTYYTVGSTSEVMRFPAGASPFGAMDMAGNVSEWTADDFKAYPGSDASPEYFQGRVARPTSPEDEAMKIVDLVPVEGKYKVLRGGSWKSDPFSTANYHRNYSWPQYASDFFGFRIAANP